LRAPGADAPGAAVPGSAVPAGALAGPTPEATP
ncbi:ATP/GTP-binding protein, partial [Streptomyces rhizosphaericola]